MPLLDLDDYTIAGTNAGLMAKNAAANSIINSGGFVQVQHDAWIWDNLGALLDGIDWEFRYKQNPTNANDSLISMQVTSKADVSTAGNNLDLRTGDMAYMSVRGVAPSKQYTLVNFIGGGLDKISLTVNGGAIAVPDWVTVEYIAATKIFTVYIYSDSGRTVPLNSTSITMASSFLFTNFMPFSTFGQFGAGGYAQNGWFTEEHELVLPSVGSPYYQQLLRDNRRGRN